MLVWLHPCHKLVALQLGASTHRRAFAARGTHDSPQPHGAAVENKSSATHVARCRGWLRAAFRKQPPKPPVVIRANGDAHGTQPGRRGLDSGAVQSGAHARPAISARCTPMAQSAASRSCWCYSPAARQRVTLRQSSAPHLERAATSVQPLDARPSSQGCTPLTNPPCPPTHSLERGP